MDLDRTSRREAEDFYISRCPEKIKPAGEPVLVLSSDYGKEKEPITDLGEASSLRMYQGVSSFFVRLW